MYKLVLVDWYQLCENVCCICLFVWMVEGGVDGWEGTSDKALGLNIRSGRVAALAAPPHLTGARG